MWYSECIQQCKQIPLDVPFISGKASDSCDSIEVNWGAAQAPKNYTLFFSKQGESSAKKVYESLPGTQTTHIESGLEANTDYCFSVAALWPGCDSTVSYQWCAKTCIPPPKFFWLQAQTLGNYEFSITGSVRDPAGELSVQTSACSNLSPSTCTRKFDPTGDVTISLGSKYTDRFNGDPVGKFLYWHCNRSLYLGPDMSGQVFWDSVTKCNLTETLSFDPQPSLSGNLARTNMGKLPQSTFEIFGYQCHAFYRVKPCSEIPNPGPCGCHD